VSVAAPAAAPTLAQPRRPSAEACVLLLRPPQRFTFGVYPQGPRLSVPIGLITLGSFLRQRGVDVRIYDCFVEGESFEGDELRRDGRGPLATRWAHHEESRRPSRDAQDTGGRVHFGASWDSLARDLLAVSPDIVGISNLFRENTEEALEAAALVRRLLPDATIVIGGPNASALPDYLLQRSPAIDMACVGDGEHCMAGVVEWAQGKRELSDVPNLVYRTPDGIARSTVTSSPQELDELGAIDYGLVRLERYFTWERHGVMSRNKFGYRGAERAVSLVTSRGCPYKCSFCSIHIHAGRKYRRYSVSHTLDHLETLVRKHGVRHVHFEDDNLTLDRPRFMELMQGILDRGLRFTWDTPNGVFANTLDEDMLRIMKRTGCIYLIVGVESGDQWVLDNVIMKQPLTLEHVRRAFALGQKVGLDMHAFYIIGFPREKMEHIQRTLDFAWEGLRRWDVMPHLALARADPGTSLYAEAQAGGTLVTDHAIGALGPIKIDAFVRHHIKTSEFTPEQLEALSDQFYKKVIRRTLARTARFLLRRPGLALRAAGSFAGLLVRDRLAWRDAVVRLFFCHLFYRHALPRQSRFEADAAR
jgi:tRNA A37 methylthiotransferase MiaB